MYKHHYQTTGRKQDNLMYNIYYSIFGQLVRQDPALYAAHVNVRPDYKTRLIVYPLCAWYYPGPVKAKTTAVAKVAFYKGDHRSYFENGSIRDKVVLLGPACLVDVVDSGVDKIRAWA
jgi:hypothetical protein